MPGQICQRARFANNQGRIPHLTTTQTAPAPLATRIKRRMERAMGPWAVFFKGFVKHQVMVGSIIPSSPFTIQKMLDPVNWD